MGNLLRSHYYSVLTSRTNAAVLKRIRKHGLANEVLAFADLPLAYTVYSFRFMPDRDNRDLIRKLGEVGRTIAFSQPHRKNRTTILAYYAHSTGYDLDEETNVINRIEKDDRLHIFTVILKESHTSIVIDTTYTIEDGRYVYENDNVFAPDDIDEILKNLIVQYLQYSFANQAR